MFADEYKRRLRSEAKAWRRAAFERHGAGAGEALAAQGLAFIDRPPSRIVSGFSSINDEIDKLRHSATAALLTRKDVIIIASVSAIYGLGSPDTYKKMTLPIDSKKGIDRREVMEKLIYIGYERSITKNFLSEEPKKKALIKGS